MIEATQQRLRFVELYFGLFNGPFELIQGVLVIVKVVAARLILARAEMLDLLAAVFEFGQAQGRRGAFKKVAEGGQLGEFSLFPTEKEGKLVS